MTAPVRHGREFFTTVTVDAALQLLAEPRRTPVETVPLAAALGRTPASPVRAAASLPGFARATVDGFAVQAADTFGASEALPAYLDVAGSVAMGRPAEVAVRAGAAVAVPTGGVLPDGADAVVMVEHTQETMPGSVEVVRPVAPGDGTVRADEDVTAGAEIAPAGRPLRPRTSACWPRRGSSRSRCTGDRESASSRPATRWFHRTRPCCCPARCVTPPPRPWPGWSPTPAASRCRSGWWSTTRQLLESVLRDALSRCDLVVVSAGSSVGARDETAGAVARLGGPGISATAWPCDPGSRPCSPTAPVSRWWGCPATRSRPWWCSGWSACRSCGGSAATTRPPPEPGVRAVLERQVPSQAGRLDVVQVRITAGAVRPVATPLFGASALLSVLTAADGYLVVPEDATGLTAGAHVDVTLYR